MTMTELASFLRRQDEVTIIGHVAPDGDCIGSCLALKWGLEYIGVRAQVVLQDSVPKKFHFLRGAEEIGTPEAVRRTPLCALSVDVAAPDRMGSAKSLFESASHTACLDHHASNPGFGEVFFVDGSRSSCAELAMELLGEWGVMIDPEAAEALFVGINTDTGNFNFANTTEDTLNAAARCVGLGARPAFLTRRTLRERSLAGTRLLGEVLCRVGERMNGGIVYSYLDNATLARTGASIEEASHVVDFINDVSGEHVCVYFEQRGKMVKISWRCSRDVDVATIARLFGGGGHKQAAGATLEMDLEKAMEFVLDRTQAALEGKAVEC